MTFLALAFTAIGVALAVALAIQSEFDVLAAVLLAFILALGGLVLAVVRRSRGDAIGPAHCPECDGVVSPNAPYCKHCGARLSSPSGG